MNFNDFKYMAIGVTQSMSFVRTGFYSPEFVRLCCMIAAHESIGGKYRVQVGGGPARGILGIEKDTYEDVWKNSDYVKEVAEHMKIERDFSQIENCDSHSIIIARLKIAMDLEAIPSDLYGIACYAKRVWNGTGKATPEKYLNDFKLWATGEF